MRPPSRKGSGIQRLNERQSIAKRESRELGGEDTLRPAQTKAGAYLRAHRCYHPSCASLSGADSLLSLMSSINRSFQNLSMKVCVKGTWETGRVSSSSVASQPNDYRSPLRSRPSNSCRHRVRARSMRGRGNKVACFILSGSAMDRDQGQALVLAVSAVAGRAA